MVFSGNGPIEIEGKEYKEDRDRPNANFENVSEGYFESLGMQLKQGRDFNADDTDAKLPVAIVNAGFAAKHFGNEDPIGRRFRTVGNRGTAFGPWRTIVGLVSNVRMTGPFNQGPAVDETGFDRRANFIVSTRGLKPSPSGEAFRLLILLHWRDGKLSDRFA